MDLKNLIIDTLKQNPKGLMAKDIAKIIPNFNKKEINQILYSDSSTFVSIDYIWYLRTKTQCSKKHNGENYKINRIEVLSLARNIYYLTPLERDEILELSSSNFKNFAKNVTLLKKAENFRYLRSFPVFKNFICLAEKDFCNAFYNAMVLGHNRIRNLTDSQWLTFILLPKNEFISALNHAIIVENYPQLKSLLYSVWLELVTMDDYKFSLKMSSFRVSTNNSYLPISANNLHSNAKEMQSKNNHQCLGEVITRCMGVCSNCNRDKCIEQ